MPPDGRARRPDRSRPDIPKNVYRADTGEQDSRTSPWSPVRFPLGQGDTTPPLDANASGGRPPRTVANRKLSRHGLLHELARNAEAFCRLACGGSSAADPIYTTRRQGKIGSDRK